MQVIAERSSLGPEATGTPVGFGANGEVIRSPVINKTNAQTTISAYSGQTVVFAGLIQKQRTSVSRRIPWLGDIPYLGALFRFDSETETRNELLIILTPRIVQTDEELRNHQTSRVVAHELLPGRHPGDARRCGLERRSWIVGTSSWPNHLSRHAALGYRELATCRFDHRRSIRTASHDGRRACRPECSTGAYDSVGSSNAADQLSNAWPCVSRLSPGGKGPTTNQVVPTSATSPAVKR